MITASSPAREGATAKAVIASAPRAAAQSERRLNWLRVMGGFLLGLASWAQRIWGSAEELHFRAAAADRNRPSACSARYAARRGLLQPVTHEFVSKNPHISGRWGKGTMAELTLDGCGSSLQLLQPTSAFPGRGAAPLRRCTAEPGSIAAMDEAWTPDQQRITPQDIARQRRA